MNCVLIMSVLEFTNVNELCITNKVQDSVKWSMKNLDRKIDPDEPWKLQIFLVWGIGTPPLTARKRTAVGILPTAKNSRTIKFSSVGHSSVAVLLRAIKGRPEALLPVAVFLPQAQNLRTVRALGLKFLNRFLTKKDEKLPFTRHVISTV